MPRCLIKPIFCCLLFLILEGVSSAQTYNPFNQRDDTYRLLGLKRAKESFESAEAEYKRQQALFDKDLITRSELERARNVFTDAEVNYQQSLLAVLFEDKFADLHRDPGIA